MAEHAAGAAGGRVLRLASAVIVVLAVLVPVRFARAWWGDGRLVARHDTPAAVLDERLAARAMAIAELPPAEHPVAISYHDLAPDAGADDVYTLTPQQFAEQMALLELAGYHAISGAEMAAYVADGAALEENSVHITFDDGTAGVWTYGDRILDRYGMRATIFVITGYVGTRQPYYLRWREIDHMRASGRWDVGGHTDDGHHRVLVSASGELGAFLGYRMWLPEQRRLERRDEWRERVTAELDRHVAVLAEHGIDGPLLLSFPFSNDGRPSNDVALAELLADIADERFAVTFTNDPRGGVLTDEQIAAGHIQRFAVRAATTPDDLLDMLEASRTPQ